MLTLRFKEPSKVALDAVFNERYTLRDAANRCEPRQYGQKIFRAAKDAGFSEVKDQLYLNLRS